MENRNRLMWEIDVSQLIGRLDINIIDKRVQQTKDMLSQLKDKDKEKVVTWLQESYKKHGAICLQDFWARVVNLGYYSTPERFFIFMDDFSDHTRKRICENRENIQEYENKERKNFESRLFK